MIESLDLAVIAPCYNEEDNVQLLAQRLVATLARAGIAGEIVLVDDGSEDRTRQRIRALESRYPNVRAICHEWNQGIEHAWIKGIAATRAPVVCFIDSDLQNRPEDVALLYAKWQDGTSDLVQAVRRPSGAERRRLVYSRTLNILLNTAFGMHLRDNKSGFVLGRRETLSLLLEHRWRYSYFQSLLGAAAGVHRLVVAEVETTFERRQAGVSFLAGFPIAAILRILLELTKYRIETCVYPPRRADG